MRTRPHHLAALALAGACTLLSGCGDGGAVSSTRAGSTLVAFGDAPVTCEAVQVTALVTRSDRGCFQLDGVPLTFPRGTSWAGSDGRTVRLPSGAEIGDGDVVSGPMCTGVPTTAWAGYDCGIKDGDPVHGLVGPVSVAPRG